MSQSATLYFFNKLKRIYFNFEDRLDAILRDSLLFKLTSIFFKWFKICLKGTLLMTISRSELTYPMLSESKIAGRIYCSYRKFENRTIYYLKDSTIARFSRLGEAGLYRFPAKIVSAFIVIGILINMSLSFILRDSVGTWSRIMCALFLVAGAIGLFCDTDLETLKKGSITLKAFRWLKRN